MSRRGNFTLILGNMFAGKTTRLVQLLDNQRTYGKSKIFVIKPEIDHRSGTGFIKSSNETFKFPAYDVSTKNPERMINVIRNEETEHGSRFTLIAIDEIQFFNPSLFQIIDFLLRESYDVIAAGLRLNFRGEPFETSTKLTALIENSSNLHILHSLCTICGKPAHYPQRIIDGKPAHYDSEIVLVGGKESYEARCAEHHEVPGKKIYF
ncbi:MAG: thymidine kinase [Patescibacteria group bacterium]